MLTVQIPAVKMTTLSVCGSGASITVPITNKDHIFSFSDMDSIEVSLRLTVLLVQSAHQPQSSLTHRIGNVQVCMPDSPRPDELVVVVAFAAGGRLLQRVGPGPPKCK